MIICPTCGDANADGSRFCSNCGTRLERSPEPEPASDSTLSERSEPSFPPRSVASDSVDLPPTAPEWRMSSPGPLPERRNRRVWLWVVLGIIGACLLVCILVYIWAATVGSDTVDGWLTAAAEFTTPVPGTPTTVNLATPDAGTPPAGP